MKNTVYLDNSSTTMPCKSAIDGINNALNENWGNPSSLHILGMNAENCISDAREKIAEKLSCRQDEIYFTSCGTEGNNTAIFGAAYQRKKLGKRIVTTSIEHPSVLEAMKRLESEGFDVVYIKPQPNGSVSQEDLISAINGETALVSIMLVNNETGAFQPVKLAAEIIKKNNAPALLHCDAVQAFGKTDIKVYDLGVDMLTVSAHKIHGPKGIGALFVKKSVTVRPLIVGGGQERGFRSGTESVPLIMGFFGAVCELPDTKSSLEKMQVLKNALTEKIEKSGIAEINSPYDGLPYIVNISLLGYRSETVLHFLESKDIYVSSGSACAKGKGSHVLNEMGLGRERTDSAIRVSFSRFNSIEDVDKLFEALIDARNSLRRSN